MQYEHREQRYLTGILRDASLRFRYRSGICRLIGMPVARGRFSASCFRPPPSLKYLLWFPQTRWTLGAEPLPRPDRKPWRQNSTEMNMSKESVSNPSQEKEESRRAKSGIPGRDPAYDSVMSDAGTNRITGAINTNRTNSISKVDPEAEDFLCRGLHDATGHTPVACDAKSHGLSHPDAAFSGLLNLSGYSADSGRGFNIKGECTISHRINEQPQVRHRLDMIKPPGSDHFPRTEKSTVKSCGTPRGDIQSDSSTFENQTDAGSNSVASAMPQYSYPEETGYESVSEDRTSAGRMQRLSMPSSEVILQESRAAKRSAGTAVHGQEIIDCEDETEVSASNSLKLPEQQVVIVKQQVQPQYETAAFWERSYLSRFRLRTLR